MRKPVDRRQLLQGSAALAASVAFGAMSAEGSGAPAEAATPSTTQRGVAGSRRMQLGMVTYNIAAGWDIPTIIERCHQVGMAAVELRTTHRHGVEPDTSKTRREEVRKQFANAGIVLWGLGSVCEYHSPDPAVVAQNIELTKRFVDLAHDVGAKGVKVRPNALPQEVEERKTLEQIGNALRVCGEAAARMGVEIWLEVHGRGTSHPPHIRTIMDVANHPNVGVTWNCNHPHDLKDGSVKPYFESLRDRIWSVHINELTNPYPWPELLQLLNKTGYDRYALIEIQAMKSAHDEDAVRFLKYYRTLWEAWSM